MRTALKAAVPSPIWRGISRIVNARPVLDLGGGASDAVFLAGSGRGGTGWVANIINFDNSYRYIYEPFHANSPIKGFPLSLYLRPDDNDPAHLATIRAVVAGRFMGDTWTHRDNRRWVASRRLIKEVRAHLWLKWLRKNFPELPIILVLRHPCAVAASRRARGHKMQLTELLGQPELIHDHLQPYVGLLSSVASLSEFGQRVLEWCVHYFVPLRQLNDTEVHVAFYEFFAANPHEEIDRVFAYLRRAHDDRALAAITRPSESAMRIENAPIRVGKSVLETWRGAVSCDEMRQAMRVLRAFGLDAIYDEETMPRREGLTHFRTSHVPSVALRIPSS